MFRNILLATVAIILAGVLGYMIDLSRKPSSKIPYGYTYKLTPLRDYQIEIVEDTILLYDGNRCVGKFAWEDSTAFGQLLLGDNE